MFTRVPGFDPQLREVRTWAPPLALITHPWPSVSAVLGLELLHGVLQSPSFLSIWDSEARTTNEKNIEVTPWWTYFEDFEIFEPSPQTHQLPKNNPTRSNGHSFGPKALQQSPASFVASSWCFRCFRPWSEKPRVSQGHGRVNGACMLCFDAIVGMKRGCWL